MGFHILLFVLLLLGYRILIYYDIFYPPPAKGILLYSISQKNYPLSPILYHPPTPSEFFPQPQNQLNNETPDEKFIPTRLVEMKRDSKRERESGQRTHSKERESERKKRARVWVRWKEKSRRIAGKFSSTTSQLHRIREEYFIHLPFVRRNREGGTSQPLSPPSSIRPSPLLRIINGQFAASAADCIVSPFSGFPSFGCQAPSLPLSLSTPSFLSFAPRPYSNSEFTLRAPSLSLHSIPLFPSNLPLSALLSPFSPAESFKVR